MSEKELEALRARVEELERKANPPEPPKFEGTPGPTTTELAMSRMAMPPQAMRVMIEAVGDDAVSGIVRDGRAPQNLSPLAAEGTVRPRLPSGMREPTPLGPPPGIAIADRLMDAADARDRADLIMQEARRRAAIKAATKEEQNE
jgi:hypothetical protein